MTSVRLDRTGLRLGLFGFPTRIQPSFLLVVGLLGLSGEATVMSVVIWTAVATVSVLWHELGHAAVAHRFGGRPTIDLYGFGGFTRWSHDADISRSRMIAVSVAGPLAGVALGLVVAVVAKLATGEFDAGSVKSHDVRYLIAVVLWVNVGWGLVNLLPVLPLDGGHVISELMPGDRVTRVRRAAMVSVGLGSVAAVVMLALGHPWGAFVFGWAVATNLTLLRTASQRADTAADDRRIVPLLNAVVSGDRAAVDELDAILGRAEGDRRAALAVVAIESGVASGEPATSRRFLDTVGGSAPPAMHGLVSCAETRGAHGLVELVEIFGREPSPAHGRWLALALYDLGRLHEVVDIVGAMPDERRRPDTVEAIAGVADWAGSALIAHAVRARPVA